MLKQRVCLLLLVVVCAAIAGCINLGSLLTGQMDEVVVRESPRWFERNRVALIDVGGFLGSARPGPFGRGITTIADVREKLDLAAGDGRVRAVVLRINSPGGEVTASDTIFREVLRFREETGKPVVASLMGTAASGGYYVALASDRIVAAPTTVTGSVGVVIQLVNVEGLFDKIGLRSEVIKSGDKKDIGSPTRPMTDEERAILDGVAQAMFEEFVRAVRARRPLATDRDIQTVSDGRVLTAGQALKLHLVDRIGYLDDAIAEAYDLAGIKAADIILYRPFPHYNANIYAGTPGSSAARVAGQGRLIEEGLDLLLGRRAPAFLYLWCPGL